MDAGSDYNEYNENKDRCKAALTAASEVLSHDESRHFYLDNFLYQLDLVLRGHNQWSPCAWLRVRGVDFVR